MLAERLADALRDGAMNLALDDHRIDDRAAVLDNNIAPHRDATRLGVDLHRDHVYGAGERGPGRIEALGHLEARRSHRARHLHQGDAAARHAANGDAASTP